MKIPVILFGLLLAAGVLSAQVPPKKPAGPVPAKKEEEKMGVIEGMTIPRPNGTFLGLTLMEGKYKLTFYDKKKKPMGVDVSRAVARWPNPQGPGDFRTVLNQGGAAYLLGAQFVRGPHAFKLWITLIKGEGDTADSSETYVVDFRG